MSTLLFLENQSQVAWAQKYLPAPSASSSWIALTAEAAEACDRFKLAYRAASDFSDLTVLGNLQTEFNEKSLRLAQDLEAFLAAREPAFRFEGPGLISAQGYSLQYAVAAVATRLLLVLQTVEALNPQRLLLFKTAIAPMFRNSTYEHNPWSLAIKAWADQRGLPLQWLECPELVTSHHRQWQEYLRVPGRLLLWLKQKIKRSAGLGFRTHPLDLELLFIENPHYDWEYVIPELNDAAYWSLESKSFNNGYWSRYYKPFLRNRMGLPAHHFSLHPPDLTSNPSRLQSLFKEWEHCRQPKLPVTAFNVDVYPALAAQYYSYALTGPAIARYSDALANRILDAINPKALCVVGLVDLAAKRLAHVFRERGIPTVCYQHGGVYGTHFSPGLDNIGPGYADYFLTYGAGVQASANPTTGKTAQFVPVGSARLETWRSTPNPKPKNKKITILWMSDTSTGNTLGGCFQFEDVKRYRLQKQGLRLLSASGRFRVIFRLFKADLAKNGIPTYLQHTPLSGIEVDTLSRSQDLISQSDLVVIDAHSNTSWNEVLALGKPLILFCHPDYTSLTPSFSADLDLACRWCKSEDVLVHALEQLIQNPQDVLEKLSQIDPSDYLRKYVLGDGLTGCSRRASNFLKQLNPSPRFSKEYSLAHG